MLRRKLNQSGETFIEVALSLAILGLVLGVSYASVNRSLRSSQDSQERTEASQHAQDLIETFRAYAESGDPIVGSKIFPSSDTQICLDASVAAIESGKPPKTYSPDPAMMPAECKKGEMYIAYLDIKTNVGGNPKKYEYKAVVQWDSVVSGQKNEAVMRYKWTES